MSSHLLLPKPPTLTQEQSLAAVKVFLNAATACIAHTRELIRWTSPCFHTRYVEQLTFDQEDVYHAFCTANTQPRGTSQQVRIMTRGKDRRAEEILDLIENGVYQAVKDRQLEQAQIFITKESDEQSILESYSFTFEYKQDKVSGIQITSSPNSDMFATSDVHKSFAASIRALLRSLKGLPSLPRRRALGVGLVFKKECPRSYVVHGFRSIRQDDCNWRVVRSPLAESFPEFEAGRYRVKIGTHNTTFMDLTTSQVQDTVMSRRLQNLQKGASPERTPIRDVHSIEDKHAGGDNDVLDAAPTPSQPREYSLQISSKTLTSARHSLPKEVEATSRIVDSSPCWTKNNLKRASEPSPEDTVSRSRRRMSVSARLVNITRSSPLSGVSIEEVCDNHNNLLESTVTASSDTDCFN